jgi:hypothetical protein
VWGYAETDDGTNLRHYTVDSINPLAITEQKRVYSDPDPADGSINPTITGAVILEDGTIACFYDGLFPQGVVHWDADLNLIAKHSGSSLGWPVLSLSGDNVQNGMVAVWYSTYHASFNPASPPTSVSGAKYERLIPFEFNQDDSYILSFQLDEMGFFRTVNGVSGRIQE